MAINNLWNITPNTYTGLEHMNPPTGLNYLGLGGITGNSLVGGGTGDTGGFEWGNFLLGDKNRPGALQLGLGTLSGIGNLYLGMKNYGVAKKQLQQQNDQFERNYAAQRSLVNSQLEDRQRARVASNPEAYESESSYMDRNRIR